jgi:hypothetical protein
MALPAQQQNEVELEIAAFMGPHIKRARIVLVLVGVLYLLSGYMNWDDISALREMVKDWPGGSGLDELKRQVSLAYAAVVIVIIAGIANIVLSAIAGVKTMFAFYAAMGIFAVHSVFLLYATGGAIVTNIIWWITAICLGMGFQAALKADKLRKGERPAASAL